MLQTGQLEFFKIGIAVKSISLKSQTNNLPLNVLPIPDRSFMVSIACMVPIIPDVAPIIPNLLQGWSVLEFWGIKHSRHPVSGGENTERLPSNPLAAPKT